MELKKIIKHTALFCVFLLIAFTVAFPECIDAEGTAIQGNDEIDLSVKGLRIGVGNGTIQEQLVRKNYKDPLARRRRDARARQSQPPAPRL